ncbi:DUF3888 domain-containing protein [Peribacillus simplex]|uniref:DUF3888 domain-containing protein n=1 Tax=Peribacillus simplex TaxID=1478 RepID=UPI00333CB270
MKLKLIFIFAIILTFGLTVQNQVFAETNTSAIEKKHTDIYDAFLTFLNPYAEEAIRKKYPERSYALWNAEILEVTRKTGGYSQYDFIVKVKYDTYTGPFNPPEGFVTLTFNVTIEGVTVTEFKE